MEIVAYSEEGIPKRKNIYECNHPFDPNPFEAFWCGSWYPVERLKVSGGTFSTGIVFKGNVVEDDVPMSHLRVKSRKATLCDCTAFLRQGVDICVIWTPGNSTNEDDEREGNSNNEDDESEDNPNNEDDKRDVNSNNEDDKQYVEPVWLDARIRSIQRKPHDTECTCQFYVSFYVDQGPDILMGNKRLSKETKLLSIDQIYVLQKLEQKPCDDDYFRWSHTEDCFSLLRAKLFTGRFLTDISWFLVTSILKQTAFDIRSIRNHVAYEISEHSREKDEKNPESHSYVLNFKVDNEILTPVILKVDPKALDDGSEGHGSESFLSYDLMELRRSKRRIIQPDRYMGPGDLDYDFVVTRLGECKRCKYDAFSDEDVYNEMPLALSVQADDEFQKHGGDEDWLRSYKRKMYEGMKASSSKRPRKDFGTFNKRAQLDQHAAMSSGTAVGNDSDFEEEGFPNFKFPEYQSKDIGEMVSKYFAMTGSPSARKKNTFDFNFTETETIRRGGGKGSRKHYRRRNSDAVSLTRDCVYVRESIYDVRGFRKGSASAQMCRELIRRCMINIDETLKNEPEQVPVVDQWKECQSTKVPNNVEREEKPVADEEEEISEIDILWKEMEMALASWFLLDDNEDANAQPHSEDKKSTQSEHICEHDFQLNEQIGTVCRLCGFVETEIKDFLPPFSCTAPLNSNKDQTAEEDSESRRSEHGELDKFCIPASSITPSVEGQGENNVWSLIPELRPKLRFHQKKAFEFLWRNIAGSLVPSRMEKKKKKRGGCVISHTPGAGKTLLIIAFLMSYLKLFPGSRPLVLAPKTTLYTWYKEIIKWKVPIPVYQIHGGQTYKGEVLKQRLKLAPGLPRNQDVLHVLDCLEKMQKWLSHPSILLMGYTSFLTLTREDSHYAHRKYMAQLLKQCPGILILDEGHNPRSTKSRLRKGLMKVNTRLRVLLSGTLFQNNFGEYFNTLCLARPVFVNEVLRELDPKYEKRNKERQTQFSLENRGRKLLIDKISKKIDSNKGEERVQALKTLKKLTSKFIDVYEGGSSDRLPGLQCYTLMMKSTSLQQDILLKLQNQRPAYKGFPLELELLITLGAIHPWLIKTTSCSRNYCSSVELDDLEQYKFDMKSGSKVRFVMNLIPRCIMRNEKVLIFCHNIAPINLFLQIFERFYGWRKGREVLVLQGDIELFERGRVMDKFEEPGGPSKVMLASITACAEGISLTAASRVILLDSEWNPSKSKQAIARAFRPGQNKVVYVYQLLATGTLEEEKHSRTTWKEWVSDMIFSEEHVEDPSHWQAPKIEDELLREIVEEDRATLFHRIMKNEKASNVIRGKGMLKNMSKSSD
ncbi:hypothetical protein F511_06681 [Dorcoceras hygrometricum]|uniref:SNF2 domain-containing protein CLASSY 1-like n=1 Tax=Dorcoceras hygrometricum TaxID=472368 RepID=A0A2Z7DEN6_9LAMI|nr:hypothetical protein F511_06681 [Dorcoceras hygrometricum]